MPLQYGAIVEFSYHVCLQQLSADQRNLYYKIPDSGNIGNYRNELYYLWFSAFYFKRVSSYDATVVAFVIGSENIWCYSSTGYLLADCLRNHLLSLRNIQSMKKALQSAETRVGETVRNQCPEDKDYSDDYRSGMLCIIWRTFVRTGYVRKVLFCKGMGNDGNFFCVADGDREPPEEPVSKVHFLVLFSLELF